MTRCAGCQQEVDTFNCRVWAGCCHADRPRGDALREWIFANALGLDHYQRGLLELVAESMDTGRSIRLGAR